MTLADACMVLLLVGLTAYLVLGGADFGAGLIDATAGRGEVADGIRTRLARSMGPLWEANHVWLIFVLVVFWSAFPVAFGSFTSTLYIPLFAAAVGIILRGSAFAFRGLADGTWADRPTALMFASSSVLTPFFLGATAGAVASGRVPVGNAAGDPLTSWWNPTGVMAGAVAVLTGVHLAAVYAAADAAATGPSTIVDALRRRALVTGVLAGAGALAGIGVIRADARPLYDDLVTGDGLPALVASAAAGVATLALVAARRFGWARIAGAGAVAAIVAGWSLAQRPDLLPGAITIEEAAAGRATLVALLVGIGAGLVVLVPALVLLFRLALTGRLGELTGRPGTEGDDAR